METKASWIIAVAFIALACGCSPKKESEPTPAPAAQELTAAAPAKAGPVQKAKPAQTDANPTTKPILDYSPKPVYPASMQERCIEGEVRVTMRVTQEGLPEDIKVVESTDTAFSDALLKVLPAWRFTPARKDGIAVARTVSIAIPFIISNRPLDLPEIISAGQPELMGVTRPPHPGKGAAKAVVRFTLSAETIVSDVQIVKVDGIIDDKSLTDSLSQWVFIPSRFNTDDPARDNVTAEITFTGAGNVLIQYPYPAPTPAP